jgi:hypothetical protein
MTSRKKAYRFFIGDVVRDLCTIHNVGQRILLQPGLRRIRDSTRAQAHDAITDLESRNAISDLGHDSNDIFAEDGRQLVCDEQAGVSASLVVGVETWRTVSVICYLFMVARSMHRLASAST